MQTKNLMSCSIYSYLVAINKSYVMIIKKWIWWLVSEILSQFASVELTQVLINVWACFLHIACTHGG